MVGKDPPSESKDVLSSIVEIGSQYKLDTVGSGNISRLDLGDVDPPLEVSLRPRPDFSGGRDRHERLSQARRPKRPEEYI